MVSRAWPPTGRIACPWLIRTFTDPDAEIPASPAQLAIRHQRARHVTATTGLPPA